MPAPRTDNRPRCCVCGGTGRPHRNRTLYQRNDYVYCAMHLLERLMQEGSITALAETLP